MDSVAMLIIVAICAWVVQIALGFIQLRAFNRMLQFMARKGMVKIGRTQSRWKPRTVVVVVEDENRVIIDARVMKGLTVFARPRPLTALIGQRFPLADSVTRNLNSTVQEALSIAFSE